MVAGERPRPVVGAALSACSARDPQTAGGAAALAARADGAVPGARGDASSVSRTGRSAPDCRRSGGVRAPGRPLRNPGMVARKTLTPTLSHRERGQEPPQLRGLRALCKGRSRAAQRARELRSPGAGDCLDVPLMNPIKMTRVSIHGTGNDKPGREETVTAHDSRPLNEYGCQVRVDRALHPRDRRGGGLARLASEGLSVAAALWRRRPGRLDRPPHRTPGTGRMRCLGRWSSGSRGCRKWGWRHIGGPGC